MKTTGILFFLAGLAAAFCQGAEELDGNNKTAVCFKNDMTLELTILKGEDGKNGRSGLKGNQGDRGQRGGYHPYGAGDNGRPGPPGLRGIDGEPGDKGERGPKGANGPPMKGNKGIKGDVGEPGRKGRKGYDGFEGESGYYGDDGEPGPDGLPYFTEEMKDLFIHALNDYQVTESGYFSNLYHVRSRDLTDGRTDSGGWGSETAKTGNYIQATFLRPVYVTSVTVAGGFIPSWGHDIRRGWQLKLEYSVDGTTWNKSTNFSSPVVQKMVTLKFQPVIAQYWRLISSEDKWVGTTEFALKPLIKP